LILRVLIITILITTSLLAQEFNTIITDEKSGKPMLIGFTSLEAFADTSFSWWWNSEYNLYSVDSSLITAVESKLENVHIEIVLGTWCSDSRREVPHFFKILEAVDYPVDSV
jgi:hypothetical protein